MGNIYSPEKHKFNVWTKLGPWLNVVVRTKYERELQKAAELIPGVRYYYGRFQVPHNAFKLFVDLVGKDPGASIVDLSWGKACDTSIWPWEKIEQKLLQAGEVRENYISSDFILPFQKEAICFAWRKGGVALWHPTGSGKTFTGLVAALSCPGPLLVVTRSGSRIQYSREITRFLRLKPFICLPSSYRRKKQQTLNDYKKECADLGRREVYVVGWDSLPDLYMEYMCEERYGPIIFDEAHRGKSLKRWIPVTLTDVPSNPDEKEIFLEEKKNFMSKFGGFVREELTDIGDGTIVPEYTLYYPTMTVAAAAARTARQGRKRITTTASAIKDRLRDLYSQLDFLEPNCWGSGSAFTTRYCDAKKGTYGWDTSGASNMGELVERTVPLVHYLDVSETHKDLPGMRRISWVIPQEQLIAPEDNLKRDFKAAKKRGGTSELEYRLQLSASMKRKAVLEKIEEHLREGHKITVFTGRRKDVEGLTEKVKALKVVREKNIWVAGAHGDTPVEERQAIVDQYMEGVGPKILIGSFQAFGEGLNMQDTDAAFFVQLPVTPGELIQAEGRFPRLGQVRPVLIYYVIGEGTVDEHLASILLDKLPPVGIVGRNFSLASVAPILEGRVEGQTEEEFAASVLSFIED